MQYLFLIGAIVLEVIATLSLRAAAMGRATVYLVVAIGYAGAFVMIMAALRGGLPLGIAYGIWTAAGVAATAIGSKLFFAEPLTRRMLGGIALIVVGVLLVEVGASR